LATPAAGEPDADVDPLAELEVEPDAVVESGLPPDEQALSPTKPRMTEAQTRRERKSTKSPTGWTSEKQTG
jgi:hypothetical protein